MKCFYITTAIDYANGSPHIGHAYEKVLADVIARYHRLNGKEVHFVTGLDEHGQKIQKSAEMRDLMPQELCDLLSVEFKDLCTQLNIEYDDFIRTTESRHTSVVSAVLVELFEKGLIYKADYTGFYSYRAEQFLQEKDKVNGEWPELYGEVVEITESNYFFKLSEHQDWLREYIETHPDFITPKFRTKQVLEFLKDPINDLCISRPRSRLAWGIPLPFDSDFVTYVWFDALLNYICAAKYGTDEFKNYWPVDLQVIGKDILLPAHAVYWPIMLKAIGLELPRQILVHGWWLKDGKKMSKSDSTSFSPLDVIQRFGADAFRYFVMREMHIGKDSNFSENLFVARYNDDLGNDLGNLVSRLLTMLHRYCDGTIPEMSLVEQPEEDLHKFWISCHTETLQAFDQYQFHAGLERIFAFIKSINKYVEHRAPWRIAKSTDVHADQILDTTLGTIAEALRLTAVILLPIIPNTATQILGLLGKGEITTWNNKLEWSNKLEGNSVGEKAILFPRVELGSN